MDRTPAVFPGVVSHGHLDTQRLSFRPILRGRNLAGGGGIEVDDVDASPRGDAETERQPEERVLPGGARRPLGEDRDVLAPTRCHLCGGELDEPVVGPAAQGVSRCRFLDRPGTAEAPIPQDPTDDEQDGADDGDEAHLGEQHDRGDDSEDLRRGVPGRLELGPVPVELGLAEGNEGEVDEGKDQQLERRGQLGQLDQRNE